MVKGVVLILGVVCFTFCGCKNDQLSTEIEKIVKEWTGKKIDRDTLCISPNSTPYKILVYTDSIGCTSCKLHLYKWNAIIKEVNDEMAGFVNFQFYFHPKNIEEIFFLFRKDSFKYPCYMDICNQLDKLNTFPKTFLLDKYNKVVCIGNPTENPQIWSLYKQIINENKRVEKTDLYDKSLITSLTVDTTILELKNLEINKTTTAKFSLKNIGPNPLVVNNVTIYCNIERRYVKLVIQGKVNNQSK